MIIFYSVLFHCRFIDRNRDNVFLRTLPDFSDRSLVIIIIIRDNRMDKYSLLLTIYWLPIVNYRISQNPRRGFFFSENVIWKVGGCLVIAA